MHQALLKFQYPKLLALLLSMLVAYLLFRMDFFKEAVFLLNFQGYLAVFIAGLLFSYGFTTPFAVAFFVTLGPEVNPLLGASIGAFGALISDLFIFEWIRSSFQDEFDRLTVTSLFRKISGLFHRHVNEGLKPYLLWTAAGFIIASPLPDEFGVSLISGFTDIDERRFIPISFAFNALGVFVMLNLG